MAVWSQPSRRLPSGEAVNLGAPHPGSGELMGYINFNLKDTINLIGGEVDVIGSGKLVAAAGQLSEPHGPESGALALLREGQGRSQPGPARARTPTHARTHTRPQAHKHAACAWWKLPPSSTCCVLARSDHPPSLAKLRSSRPRRGAQHPDVGASPPAGFPQSGWRAPREARPSPATRLLSPRSGARFYSKRTVLRDFFFFYSFKK